MLCPVCKKELTEATKAKPFCSERCRSVDLGKWLDEEYRVPVTESSDVPEGTEEES